MSDRRTAGSGAEIIERNLPAITELCRRFGVRRLHLFGSAATGSFDPARSDLDFLVEFEEMPPGRYATACFGLRQSLQQLLARPIAAGSRKDRTVYRRPES
jgi:uncharacterized protein